ncbi:UDP-glucose 4-epimerase [Shewanella colwelliana]|uniref:UDP-glucose 4-epimerase n=1 Tax=Shewanella colwelliana TaxID=23 RepID=A0ABQ4PGV2_SHECO|nr:SDR family oxidoreductase [Shewanella colwelliana]GIU46648.1 UDP-glucose 4-epimerase [Shewanella colwelliana]
MNILVTGGTGFVGDHLLKRLLADGFEPLCLVRVNSDLPVESYVIPDLNSQTRFDNVFRGIDLVIHCAARVHAMNDQSSNLLDEFREVNTAGTINLARQAVDAGVKRFIFVSTIKVNGESTAIGKPFTESDDRCPEDFYGKSKSEAEVQLLELAKETGLEVVIIRPTLVYGPGVKANFASLLKLVSKGLPLPFGCIKDNKRSLVSVKNLVDLIVTCVDHPKAANQVFLVSDDHDISTAEMVKHMSQAQGKSCRLLPVPLWCYRLVGKFTGKMDVVDRLLGSLQVDITHTKNTLGWTPPQTLEDCFKETAEAFLLNKNK